MYKEKNVDHVMEAQDGDVAGIIDPMLLEPNHDNDYYNGEKRDNVGSTIRPLSDDNRNDEFQEEMYRTFEDIPDNWLQYSFVQQDIQYIVY
ncbi:hypothetical protein KY285_016348 [Solanum tuberosum]|nr:hypothetical protein KY284_016342 [Solanum tuberosum]KAH0702070.1 hypothetical protein KY285_016348 [Solanum tuberosum]